jgi:hypothetical protein
MEEVVRWLGFAVGTGIVGAFVYLRRSRERDRDRDRYRAAKDDLEAAFQRRIRDGSDR